MPQIQLSRPHRRLLGPAWVSRVPQPVKSTFRDSALPSPSVSFKKSVSGAWCTITPPFANDDAGRDAQLVGEDRELVGPAVAVGVFADLDPVASLPVAA